MSGSEQLKILLTYLKSSINKIAVNTGINKQVLYDIKNGKIKSLSNNLILTIAKTYPQISAEWLLTGQGEMLKVSNDIEIKGNIIDEWEVMLKSQQSTINNLSEVIKSMQEHINALQDELNDERNKKTSYPSKASGRVVRKVQKVG